MVQFVVEQAGCSSCAELIREALGVIGSVEKIDVDESADVAHVRLVASRDVHVDEVNRVLNVVSESSGHAYRVQLGSLTASA